MKREKIEKYREISTRGPLLLVTLAILTKVEGIVPKPELGDSIPVFGGYEHLDGFMRSVIRRPDDGEYNCYIGRVNVFKNVPAKSKPLADRKSATFSKRNIEVKLCPDVDTLIKNYFCHFYIEGLDKPWFALNADWSPTVTAKRFGIAAFYLTENYSYVLLRVGRGRDSKRIDGSPDSIEIKNAVVNTINKLPYLNNTTLANVMVKYGSHFITYLITGDSLYQVFVYERSKYNFLESELNNRGLRGLSKLELNLYFSPWLAVHQGKILTASGNLTVEDWAAKNLLTPNLAISKNSDKQIHSLNGRSVEDWAAEHLRHPNMPILRPSLIQLHKNETLTKLIGNLLQDEAILTMNLEALTPLFKKIQYRRWFEDYIYRYLQELDSSSENEIPSTPRSRL